MSADRLEALGVSQDVRSSLHYLAEWSPYVRGMRVALDGAAKPVEVLAMTVVVLAEEHKRLFEMLARERKRPEPLAAEHCTKIHDLKCLPAPFGELEDGRKRCEIRRDDRGYKVGDWLVLREWKPEGAGYTGRALKARITSIIRIGDWVPVSRDGDVVLSLDWPCPACGGRLSGHQSACFAGERKEKRGLK